MGFVNEVERISTYSREALPPGWDMATISQLIDNTGLFADGDWIESKDQNPEGDVRLIQLADIGDGAYRNKSARFLTSSKAAELGCKFLEPEDVLVARMPEPLGRACIFPGDVRRAVTAVDVCIIRPGTCGVNNRWLMFALNSPAVREVIESLQSGSTRKRISRSNLAKLEFPVPPVVEQHRIVAKIEELFPQLDAGVASLKRVQAHLQRYKTAVLKAACEGRLVPQDPSDEPASQLLERILAERRAQWEEELRAKGKDPNRAKYEEQAPPETGGLPELPQGWVWSNIGALTVQGPQNGLYLPQSAYGRGVPILRIDDFQGGASRSSEELRVVDANPEDVERYSLREGDLVINRVNSLTHLGKCLIVGSRNLPSLFESNMMRLRIAEEMGAAFVGIFLRSELGRRFLTANAKWAVNQASINQVDVAKTPVPIPPLEEQHRIVAEVERCLSVVQELEATVEANLKRAERLRQAILRQAFEGKLVPQDPSDEPASVLLAGIRGKKKTEPNAKQPKQEPRQMAFSL